jgi:uncharacterized repeat protein (TIGR01451 family)
LWTIRADHHAGVRRRFPEEVVLAEHKSVTGTRRFRLRTAGGKSAVLFGVLAVAYAVCTVGTPAPRQQVVPVAHTIRTCDSGAPAPSESYKVLERDKAIQFVVVGANGSQNTGNLGDNEANGGGYGATVTATLALPANTQLVFIKASGMAGCHRGGSGVDGSGYGGGSSAVVDKDTGEVLIEAGGGGGAGLFNGFSYGGRGGNAGGPNGGQSGSVGGSNPGPAGSGGGVCTAGSQGNGSDAERVNANIPGGGGGGGCAGGSAGGHSPVASGGSGGGGASSYVAPEFGSTSPAFQATGSNSSTVTYRRTAASVTLTATGLGAAPNAQDKITYTVTAQNIGETTPGAIDFDLPQGWVATGCTKISGTTTAPATLPTDLGPPDTYGGSDGETLQCTYTRAITQTEIDSHALVGGQITARVTTKVPDPITVAIPSNQTSTEVVPAPALTLDPVTVSAAPTGGFVAGSTVNFTLTATNSGNTSLTKVVNTVKLPIAKPVAGGPTEVTLTCPAAATNAAPGAKVTCTTGNYTVTADDVKAGAITATAGAAATEASATPQPVPITLAQNKSFLATLTHVGPTDAQPDQKVDAGDTITFTARLTNNGTAPLRDASISVAALPGCVKSTTTLDTGASVECVATYTVTQSDMNLGSVRFTATGQASDAGGTGLQQQNPDDQVALTGAAGLTAALSAVSSTPTTRKPAAGDVIHYSVLVTNTGTVSLSQLTTKDTQAPAPAAEITFTCEQTALDPAATSTCAADYTITTDDISEGKVANTIVVSGKPPTGNAVSGTDTKTVDLEQSAQLSTLIKVTAPGDNNFDGLTNTGDTPLLEISVTNSGNVPVAGLVPAATANGATLDCGLPTTPLAPGETVTCEPSYTVKTADVTAGSIKFVSDVTGTDPAGSKVDATFTLNRTTGADPVTSTPPTPPTDDTSVTTSPSAVAVVTTTGSPAAATAAAGKASGGSLPTTGSDVGGLLAICAMLALVGGGLLLLVRPARRRRRG